MRYRLIRRCGPDEYFDAIVRTNRRWNCKAAVRVRIVIEVSARRPGGSRGSSAKNIIVPREKAITEKNQRNAADHTGTPHPANSVSVKNGEHMINFFISRPWSIWQGLVGNPPFRSHPLMSCIIPGS